MVSLKILTVAAALALVSALPHHGVGGGGHHGGVIQFGGGRQHSEGGQFGGGGHRGGGVQHGGGFQFGGGGHHGGGGQQDSIEFSQHESGGIRGRGGRGRGGNGFGRGGYNLGYVNRRGRRFGWGGRRYGYGGKQNFGGVRGGGNGFNGQFSNIRSFGKALNRGKCGGAAKVFEDLSKTEGYARNMEQASEVYFKSVHGISIILDSWIEGMGNIYARMNIVMAKAAFCGKDSSRIAPDYERLNWPRPSFCNGNWGSQWGFRSYSGSCEAQSLIEYYELKECSSQIQQLARRANGGQEFSSGTRNELYVSLLKVARIIDRDSSTWNKEDVIETFEQTVTIMSSISSSYNANMGKYISRHYISYYQYVAKQMGVDLNQCHRRVKHVLRRCNSDSLGGTLNQPKQFRWNFEHHPAGSFSIFRNIGRIFRGPGSSQTRYAFRDISQHKNTQITSFDQGFQEMLSFGRAYKGIGNRWVRGNRQLPGFGTQYFRLIRCVIMISACTENGALYKANKKKGWDTPKICQPNYGREWGWKPYSGSFTAEDIIKYNKLENVKTQIETLKNTRTHGNGFNHVNEQKMYKILYDTASIFDKDPNSWDENDITNAYFGLPKMMSYVTSGYHPKLGKQFLNSYFEHYNSFSSQFDFDMKSQREAMFKDVSQCVKHDLGGFIQPASSEDEFLKIQTVANEVTNNANGLLGSVTGSSLSGTTSETDNTSTDETVGSDDDEEYDQYEDEEDDDDESEVTDKTKTSSKISTGGDDTGSNAGDSNAGNSNAGDSSTDKKSKYNEEDYEDDDYQEEESSNDNEEENEEEQTSDNQSTVSKKTDRGYTEDNDYGETEESSSDASELDSTETSNVNKRKRKLSDGDTENEDVNAETSNSNVDVRTSETAAESSTRKRNRKRNDYDSEDDNSEALSSTSSSDSDDSESNTRESSTYRKKNRGRVSVQNDDEDIDVDEQSTRDIEKTNRRRQSQTESSESTSVTTLRHYRGFKIFREFSQSFKSKQSKQIYRQLSKRNRPARNINEGNDVLFESLRGVSYVNNKWQRGFGDYYNNMVAAFVRIQSCTPNGVIAKKCKSKGWGIPRVCNENYGHQWRWKKFKGIRRASAEQIIEHHGVNNAWVKIEEMFAEKSERMTVTEREYKESAYRIAQLFKTDSSEWTEREYFSMISNVATGMGALANGHNRKLGKYVGLAFFRYYKTIAREFNVKTETYERTITTNISKCTTTSSFGETLTTSRKRYKESEGTEVVDDEEYDDDQSRRRKPKESRRRSHGKRESEEDDEEEYVRKSRSGKGRRTGDDDGDDDSDDQDERPRRRKGRGRGQSDDDDDDSDDQNERPRRRKERGRGQSDDDDDDSADQNERPRRRKGRGRGQYDDDDEDQDERPRRQKGGNNRSDDDDDDGQNERPRRRKGRGRGQSDDDDDEDQNERPRRQKGGNKRSEEDDDEEYRQTKSGRTKTQRRSSKTTSNQRHTLRHYKAGSLYVFKHCSNAFSSSETQQFKKSLIYLSKRKRPAANYDEAFDVFFRIVRLVNYIGNKVSEGLGDVYRDMLLAIFRRHACVSDGIIYKRSKSKGWGRPKVCHPDFGTRWGWRQYKGSYSDAQEVYSFYNVKTSWSRIQEKIRKQSNFQGTKKTFYQFISKQAEIYNKGASQWDQEDILTSVRYLASSFGAIVSGHYPKMGNYASSAFLRHFSEVYQNYKTSNYVSQTRQDISKCGYENFNGAVEKSKTTYVEDDNSEVSQSSDDGENSGEEENDDADDAFNDGSGYAYATSGQSSTSFESRTSENRGSSQSRARTSSRSSGRKSSSKSESSTSQSTGSSKSDSAESTGSSQSRARTSSRSSGRTGTSESESSTSESTSSSKSESAAGTGSSQSRARTSSRSSGRTGTSESESSSSGGTGTSQSRSRSAASGSESRGSSKSRSSSTSSENKKGHSSHERESSSPSASQVTSGGGQSGGRQQERGQSGGDGTIVQKSIKGGGSRSASQTSQDVTHASRDSEGNLQAVRKQSGASEKKQQVQYVETKAVSTQNAQGTQQSQATHAHSGASQQQDAFDKTQSVTQGVDGSSHITSAQEQKHSSATNVADSGSSIQEIKNNDGTSSIQKSTFTSSSSNQEESFSFDKMESISS